MNRRDFMVGGVALAGASVAVGDEKPVNIGATMAEEGFSEQDITAMTLGVLRVRPGDVLVFRTDARICGEGAAKLDRICDRLFPGHRIMILDQGADLGVARMEAGE